MRIAVIGGTGLMGKLVMAEIAARGHQAKSLSRSSGADVVAGTGLDLTDCDVVIDAFGVTTQSESKAVNDFSAAAAHLTQACARDSVGHYVLLSIVNCDDSRLRKMGYYQGKVAQEKVVSAAGLPSTIVRTTQWFEFAEQVAQQLKLGPVSLIPKMRSQPVSAASVASYLVDMALAAPAASGRAHDFAGPEVLTIPEIVKKVYAHRGIRRRFVTIPIPGVQKAINAGALLPGPDALIDSVTLADWLQRASSSS